MRLGSVTLQLLSLEFGRVLLNSSLVLALVIFLISFLMLLTGPLFLSCACGVIVVRAVGRFRNFNHCLTKALVNWDKFFNITLMVQKYCISLKFSRRISTRSQDTIYGIYCVLNELQSFATISLGLEGFLLGRTHLHELRTDPFFNFGDSRIISR